MLSELFIKNFALIDELRVRFQSGFSALTGETGAGKSILVEAMGLLTGGRASPQFVRAGEKEAVLEAIFEESKNKPLLSALDGMGLHHEDSLIIRRHISAEGKHRIYINGNSAALSQLEKIGEHLVDLSGQFDQQLLLHEKNHGSFLDSFVFSGKNQDQLKQYADAYGPFKLLQQEVETLRRRMNEGDQRAEFLRFQVREIEEAKIADDHEEENLIHERKRSKNVDFLAGLSREATALLSEGGQSLVGGIRSLLRKLEKGIELDPKLSESLETLKQGLVPLEEAAHFFSCYADGLVFDPNRLEEIESRLYQLQQLRRKYGAALFEIRQKGESLRKELYELENRDEILSAKETELAKRGPIVLELAQILSKERKKGAKKLEQDIQEELASLSMPQVRFCVNVGARRAVPLQGNPAANDCTEHGIDEIIFEFSANPGEPPRPLKSVASGGELSRVLLAIKKVLGGSASTAIFDEIDTGIGGAVAAVVGAKLKDISKKSQVLCVTHLAQIASQADHHYRVDKAVQNGKTRVGVDVLESKKERVEELARMLGGVAITQKTREHAREMLEGNSLIS